MRLNFDGSCWPNPGGLARYGFILQGYNFGPINDYGVVGDDERMSNNHAELYAMSEGLERFLLLKSMGLDCNELNVHGDSQVAIRLMTGNYRANRQKLYYPQFVRAKIAEEALAARGVTVMFWWCPREDNQEADDLSKMPVYSASPELISEAESLLSTTCERATAQVAGALADLLADV